MLERRIYVYGASGAVTTIILRSTLGAVVYRVERIASADWFILPVRYVLHDPRGRRWVLMLSRERPDRLVACHPMSPFQPLPASLRDVAFAIDVDGELIVAPPDA